MPIKSRIGLLRRRAVLAAGVIAALAIAAPVAEASAQTPALPLSGSGWFPGTGDFAGYGGAGFGGAGFGGAGFGGFGFGTPVSALAMGPTVIGDVFNGGTTVVVSTSPAQGNTIASP
jgi:hypothetical protein